MTWFSFPGPSSIVVFLFPKDHGTNVQYGGTEPCQVICRTIIETTDSSLEQATFLLPTNDTLPFPPSPLHPTVFKPHVILLTFPIDTSTASSIPIKLPRRSNQVPQLRITRISHMLPRIISILLWYPSTKIPALNIHNHIHRPGLLFRSSPRAHTNEHAIRRNELKRFDAGLVWHDEVRGSVAWHPSSVLPLSAGGCMAVNVVVVEVLSGG